jgi:hypothetical protein
MPEDQNRFRSGDRRGIAAALAQKKFYSLDSTEKYGLTPVQSDWLDRFRSDERRFYRRRAELQTERAGMADIEYAAPVIQQLMHRPVARYGFDPKSIIQVDPGEKNKMLSGALGWFSPYKTDWMLREKKNRDRWFFSNPKIEHALRQRPDIEENLIILAGAATPDTREESYATVLHEAAHRGLENLGNEFGEGWLNAETEEFRDKYNISGEWPIISEVIVRLLDYMGAEMGDTLPDTRKKMSDTLIRKYTNLKGDDLAGKMFADPMVSDLIRRLQGQADLQTQHEGRPEGATRFAVDSIPETSDKRPPPEVRTTGPRDRLVAWQGRKKKP